MKWTGKIRNMIPGLLPPILATFIKRSLRASPYRPERVARETAGHPHGAAILNEAWKHLDTTANLSREIHGIPASSRWVKLLDRMRDDISGFKSAQEAIIFAQTRIDFDHRDTIGGTAHLFQLHAQTLKDEFPHFARLVDELSDSRYSRPETMLTKGSQLVSNVFFFHLSYLLQCLTWVAKPDIVCEIGGGYGAPARLWLLNSIHQPKTYVIVDFPESLFFAEVFLRSNFDGLNLHYVTDAKPIELDFMRQFRVVLCPIHHVEALGRLPIDLVINTGSMQEMTEEWIDFWMLWLKRQDCRFFYSLNYFGQPLNFLAESGNVWSPRPTPEWTARIQRFNPAFVMQQTNRNYAEMLYEKTGASPLASPTALGARYQLIRERFLNGQTLLECMDIVRLNAGEEIMWDLLQRAMDMRTLPKEAYFLAETLHRTGSGQFRRLHGEKLTEIIAHLQQVRALGRENTYSN